MNKIKIALLIVMLALLSISPNGVTAQEANKRFSIEQINEQGAFSVLSSHDTYKQAREAFNKLNDANVVIKDSTNLSPMKIVAMKRGKAQSYPFRKGSINATGIGADGLVNIFKSDTLSGDRAYTPAHYQLYYIDTVEHASGELLAKVEVSGFVGYIDINKVDLIPSVFLERGLPVKIGGNEHFYKNPEQPITMVLKPDVYTVSYNSVYKINELNYFYRLGWPNSEHAIYALGRAPEWLPVGTYYSADGMYFYHDLNLTKPVVDKSGKHGQYVNYFQYLPLRSKSNITGQQLDAYIKAQGFNHSIYADLGQVFVEQGQKYGMNPLLVHAMANLESAFGTSSIALSKYNLFGWNAYDSDPGQATAYDGISHVVEQHMAHNLRGYTSLNDWRFYGYSVGNKGSGFNKLYASDPYWGAKIASIAYRTDRANGFKDLEAYQLGQLLDNSGSNVRASASMNAAVLYTTPGGLINQFITLNREVSDFYETYSTYPMVNGQVVPYYNNEQQVEIDLNTNLGYIHKSIVSKVNKNFTSHGSVIPKDQVVTPPVAPEPGVPEKPKEDKYTINYQVIPLEGLNVRASASASSKKLGALASGSRIYGTKVMDGWVEFMYNGSKAYLSADYLQNLDETPNLLGDVNLDGKISSGDYGTLAKHLLGERLLTGQALKNADTNQDGRVTSGDYGRLAKHLLGEINLGGQ